MRAKYTEFVNESNREGSNKATSYIRALDMLGAILKERSNDFSGCSDIWTISSPELISQIYEYVLVQQREGERGIFKGHFSPSYWRNRFYSAALKSYREFLVVCPHEERLWKIYKQPKSAPETIAHEMNKVEIKAVKELVSDRDLDFRTKEGRDVGMKTAELMKTLMREYPFGVSLEPMALRLLHQKISFEDWQIEALKAEMFQLDNGLWYSRDMITDVESRLAFRSQATKWLMEYDCFSVGRLYEHCYGVLNNINTIDRFILYLKHLDFLVDDSDRLTPMCFSKSDDKSRQDCLLRIVKKIEEQVKMMHGTLALNEIEVMCPHLTKETLEKIRVKFMHDIHVLDMGGVTCWRSIEAVPLPDNFHEIVTLIVDTLVSLGEKISVSKLEFSLNMFYRSHFRVEHNLTDNFAFMRICAKHYQGEHDVFSKKHFRTVKVAVKTGKKRSATRFHDLDVPIGSKLVFTENKEIFCFVVDDFNHVEYNHSEWTISALAYSLRGNKPSNGFCFFEYNGETLWDRRMRFEREESIDV